MIIGTTMCFSDDSGDCCGGGVNFGNTIPSIYFIRQAAGPSFYVKQGYLSGMRDMALPCTDVNFWICCLPHERTCRDGVTNVP